MYKFERLSDDIKIAVSNEHTFGTDAVLLSYFANPKVKDVMLDMGTGCGIIPLLWARNERLSNIFAIDIQQNAIEQVEESIKENKIENRFSAKQCDLRNINQHFKAESFSLVTMNPPYKPINTGIESLSESAKIARHEVCCSVMDATKAASYLLKYGGRFCMCHRPERLVDVITAFRQCKIEPKTIRFVTDKKGEEPFLFLIEGKKGSKPFLRVLPELSIKKDNGKFTDEMIEIYGSYADGYDK